MKALLLDNHLHFDGAYPVPQPPSGEVLIKVRLAGICATDLELTRGYMNFKGVPGHEFVGQVVSGPEAWLNKRVVGEINCVCRTCDMCSRGLANHCRQRTVLGILQRDGAFAEYLTLPESNLHELPATISDEQAIFVEPLAAAYQILRQCPIEPRTQVTVLGSGRLGILVAQVLKLTACRLKVVGRNPHTLGFCERFHVQVVALEELVPRQDQDVVVDCTGTPDGLTLAMQLLRPRGTLILKSTYTTPARLNLTPAVVDEFSIVGSRCGPFAEAITALAGNKVEVATMIGRTFPLDAGLEAFQAAMDPRNLKVVLNTCA